MLVKEISEQHIQDIGHAFGYYDYGEEKGMASWFRDKEAVVTCICGFVRCVLTDGFLHTTSERGEGYIAPTSCRGRRSVSRRRGSCCGGCCNP